MQICFGLIVENPANLFPVFFEWVVLLCCVGVLCRNNVGSKMNGCCEKEPRAMEETDDVIRTGQTK
jgi:hypothetical protein